MISVAARPRSTAAAASELLRAAMARHADEDIEGALAEARSALEVAPDFAEALSYLGTTLITRKGRYTEGLTELKRARDAAPDDPAIAYTSGWCAEFVAHRIERRPQPGLDARELYQQAETHLRHCLELRPEGKLKDDAKDLLASIIKEDVG